MNHLADCTVTVRSYYFCETSGFTEGDAENPQRESCIIHSEPCQGILLQMGISLNHGIVVSIIYYFFM